MTYAVPQVLVTTDWVAPLAEGRELSTDVPSFEPATCKAAKPDMSRHAVEKP